MDCNVLNLLQQASEMSLRDALSLYSQMYKIRKAEEKVIALYPMDRLKTPMHMSLGQEAASVGVIAALKQRGDIFATYRSHAAFLAQTEDFSVFFAEMYGKSTGTAEGRSGSMHLAFPEKHHYLSSAIVASCLPVAVGAGYANKIQKNGRIAVVFFGDGALDEGVFWESLNAACLYKLPVLFVCEDNQFAVHTHKSERHGYTSIDRVVQTFRCASFADETNDVESIYRMTQKAVSEALDHQMPVFLRIQCHRYLEHVGIHEDWNAKYREKHAYCWWYENDSLKMQRQRLLQRGMSDEQMKEQEELIDRQIDAAVEEAELAEMCSPQRLYSGVFYEED